MAGKKSDALAGLAAPRTTALDQIVRYLSTWKGTDNFLEVCIKSEAVLFSFFCFCFSSLPKILSNLLKIAIPVLHLGARLQHRAGFRKSKASSVGERLTKLGPLIGDSRMLFCFWGILPIVQWLLSQPKYPPGTSRLLKLERWQVFTMLGYFPAEQLYYLRVHDIIPSAVTFPIIGKSVGLNAKKLLLASSRFYLAFVVLEFFRLKEQSGLLHAKQKALTKAGANDTEAIIEKAELENSWDVHKFAAAYNIFRLPGALHWSLESGIALHDVTDAVLGLAASLITFRGLWAAAGTILPPPPASDEKRDEQEEEVRTMVKEAEPCSVEPDTGVSEPTGSSYVEVKNAQG